MRAGWPSLAPSVSSLCWRVAEPFRRAVRRHRHLSRGGAGEAAAACGRRRGEPARLVRLLPLDRLPGFRPDHTRPRPGRQPLTGRAWPVPGGGVPRAVGWPLRADRHGAQERVPARRLVLLPRASRHGGSSPAPATAWVPGFCVAVSRASTALVVFGATSGASSCPEAPSASAAAATTTVAPAAMRYHRLTRPVTGVPLDIRPVPETPALSANNGNRASILSRVRRRCRRQLGVRTVVAIVISSESYRLVVITGCAAFAEPGKKISGGAALVA
jgi:hypothetical protein